MSMSKTAIGALHHIGLAIPDLDAAVLQYSKIPGAMVGPEFTIPGLAYRLAYVEIGGAKLELVQPTTTTSTAARYLESHPQGGVYHLAYLVEDVRAAAANLVAQGAAIVGPSEPRIEGDGHHVLVVDARQTHGTMIELRQAP